MMDSDSVWRVTDEPPFELEELQHMLAEHYEYVVVDGVNGDVYPAELVPLQKLPTPALDKHGIAVAQLLTSIHTLAREALQANLTDHTHFSLDEARQGMLECLNTFFAELQEQEIEA